MSRRGALYVIIFEMRVLRPFSPWRRVYNTPGDDDMTIFEKVAIEHGTTPAEVRAEIEAAIEHTGLEISAEDLIKILANVITAQSESRG